MSDMYGIALRCVLLVVLVLVSSTQAIENVFIKSFFFFSCRCQWELNVASNFMTVDVVVLSCIEGVSLKID